MLSAMYYSGRPIQSSVVKFNEYDTNKTRLHEFIKEKILVVNEGG